MKLYDLIRLALGALFERRTRAILTILGIVVGPLIIVAITASVQGVSDSALGLIEKDISPQDIIVVPNGKYISSYVVETLSQIPGVKVVVPYYTIAATMLTPQGPKPVTILSANLKELEVALPGLGLQNGLYPAGSSLNEVDVGYYIATPQYLGQPTYHTGQEITSCILLPDGSKKTITFFVTGELNNYGITLGTIDINRGLLASDSLGRSIYGSEYSGAIVVASSLGNVQNIVNQIHTYLGSYVQVFTTQDEITFIQQQVSAFNLLLAIVGSASFIVAFISVLTTMITAVVERTREIGLLMSLGFTRTQVMLTFLTEATIMGIIGGGIGILIGYLSSFAFLDLILSSPIFRGLNASPEFYLGQGIGLFISIMIITTIAGIVPAYRASKIEPAKALRYEV
ncbi:ABC transporter permease [Stygiolobus caldivivus]|uniref:Multidrug ABC transporter substrate-binding protein n=1 Tax=Stygiolobus caldivivus TaxID=2824673 RepID=A0A8D5ZJR9_9CREN|nr:ABC transporter permease [Stygiolobus caldivivus]BCU70921.1 multidrug ABC transporter substrate-binding protein [Stygiolobus caldivivus]